MLLIALVVNIRSTKLLAKLETLAMVIHIMFWIGIFITVCVIPPTRNSAAFVFSDFENNSGWASSGVAWSLGMLTSAYVMTGKYMVCLLIQWYSMRR